MARMVEGGTQWWKKTKNAEALDSTSTMAAFEERLHLLEEGKFSSILGMGRLDQHVIGENAASGG